MNDLRLALRRLRRSPRFAVATAMTLAVGVGGASGIFALVDAVLLRPLPYPDPDRLVVVTHSAPGLDLDDVGNSYGTYQHYHDNAQALQGFAVYSEGTVELSDGGEPERVRTAVVTPMFFSTLGVAPALGRPFGPEDGLPGEPEVVILGHDLWTRRYGADPGIVGRTVELDRAAREVVGVMPRGFGFPRPETEVWYAQHFPAMRGPWLNQLSLSGIARLTANASPQSTERELNVLVASLAVTPSEAREVEEAGLAVHVQPLHAAMLGDLAGVLWLVLAATVLVLAIAAANVANLFLVRAEERRVEIAVRASLGAGRGERIRTFLIEGLVLGAVAGVLAVPLAVALVQGVVALGPTDLPRMHEVGFGVRHGFVAVSVSLLLGVVLSAVPALRGIARAAGTSSLRVDQRVAAGPAHRRVMQLLTVGEIAIGFTLLAGATLLLQSFERLRSVDPGFDPESVLTMEITLPARLYREEWRSVWRTLVERIEALPGVEAAGAAALLPLTTGVSSEDWMWEPVLVEHAPQSVDALPMAPFLYVTPGYFEALRMTVLAGEASPRWSATGHAAVVSASFARRFLGERNPLGARVRPDAWREMPWNTVTAVVADVRDDGLAADPAPIVYVPVAEALGDPWYRPLNMSLVIRTSVPPLTLAGAVRAVVHDLDPKLPIARVRTLEDIVAQATAPERFMTLALSLAAMIALFLAAVGTYGLVAYAVSRRTHELGVRIALGASGARVRRLVLRQGAGLAVAGVGIGLFLAWLLGDVLQGLLYEIRASDPATLVGASLVLVAVVLLAVDVPARRATRVDPMEALRYE